MMDLAAGLFKAIESGDVDAVRELYSPDAVIWHNFDGVEQSVEDNLRVLGWMASTFKVRSYDDVRRTVYDGGFVQQHVLRLTKADGTVVELPACIVATCTGDHITRTDEYLDSAHVARPAG